MKRNALSERCFHSDSLQVVGFISPSRFLGQLVRETLECETRGYDVSSLHFYPSGISGKSVSANHSAHEISADIDKLVLKRLKGPSEENGASGKRRKPLPVPVEPNASASSSQHEVSELGESLAYIDFLEASSCKN